MEKEKKLLNAIGDIDEKYIEEARPEKVVRISSKRSWKPLGIMAAAAVIILGLGIYMKMNVSEQAATMMAPVEAEVADQKKSAGPVEAAQEKSAEKPEAENFRIQAGEDTDLKSLENIPAPAISGDAEGATEDKSAASENGVPSRAMIANPWIDSDSLAEAVLDAGFDMTAPEAVNSFMPKYYRSIKDDMLEIIYCDSEDKEAFRIRKARKSDEDISGDYNAYETEKDITASDITAHLKANGTDVFVATWSKDDFDYSVVVDENHHLTEEDMTRLITEIN